MRQILLVLLMGLAACSHSAKKPNNVQGSGKSGYDAELTGYSYPFPIKYFSFASQQQTLKMAYMDLQPVKPTEKVFVLLHGKNFSGAYFKAVAEALVEQGYRVIIPDQIGFGKSTKPKTFQYSIHALAVYTLKLLDEAGATKFTLLGHSMGGMVATRMALLQPARVEKLFLENPIGLEDWRLLTPYKGVDDLYLSELKSSGEKIKAYQLEYYYNGQWKPEYQPWLDMQVGWQDGPDYPLIAWNSALTSEMVFTQPVYYEFKLLRVPTVLIIGLNDKTAIGKGWAPPENQSKMGNYPRMSKDVANQIPNAKLVELRGLGHAPHIEAFDVFIAALKANL